jgi:hypothetical protein
VELVGVDAPESCNEVVAIFGQRANDDDFAGFDEAR